MFDAFIIGGLSIIFIASGSSTSISLKTFGEETVVDSGDYYNSGTDDVNSKLYIFSVVWVLRFKKQFLDLFSLIISGVLGIFEVFLTVFTSVWSSTLIIDFLFAEKLGLVSFSFILLGEFTINCFLNLLAFWWIGGFATLMVIGGFWSLMFESWAAIVLFRIITIFLGSVFEIIYLGGLTV